MYTSVTLIFPFDSARQAAYSGRRCQIWQLVFVRAFLRETAMRRLNYCAFHFGLRSMKMTCEAKREEAE